jgi:hypothetical protein
MIGHGYYWLKMGGKRFPQGKVFVVLKIPLANVILFQMGN